MDTVAIDKLQYLQIGTQGNNNALTVPIDMTSWVEEFPDKQLCCFVLFVPPGEKNPWPVTSTWNATTNILTWEITSGVTAVDGQGYAEVRALEQMAVEVDPETETILYDGLVKKSRTIPVMIDSSVSGIVGGSRPAPYQDFLNQVLTVKSQLNEIFSGAVTQYAVSTSYQSAPETGWSTTMPDLVENKGKYLWSRTTLEWATGSVSNLDNVSYIAEDASGAVTSINGKTGAAILDGNDIKVDRTDESSPTIQTALSGINTLLNPLPIANGGTGATTAYTAAKALMLGDGPAMVNDAFVSTDYVYIANAAGTSIKRKQLSHFQTDIFTAAGIHAGTGGYVVKTQTVTMVASDNYLNYRFAADDANKKVRVQRGEYISTIENWSSSNIPLGVSLMSGFNSGDSSLSDFVQGNGELSFSQPVFNLLNGVLQIRLPFTLAFIASTSAPETFAESVKVRVNYLAAT